MDVNKIYSFSKFVDNVGGVERTFGELDHNYNPVFITAYQNSNKFHIIDLEDYNNNYDTNDDDDDDNNEYKLFSFPSELKHISINLLSKK